MKFLHLSMFVALIGSSAVGVGCSDEAGGGTTTGGTSGNSGGSSTGGKANSGGTGGVTNTAGGTVGSGGKAPTGGNGTGGGITGGSSSGGSSSGTGGGLNLANCDEAAVAALFTQKRCKDCHSTAAFQTTAGLTSWIGKLGEKPQTMTCANRTVIVAGSPATSLLYIKLAGTPPAGCGAQMPKPESANQQLVPFTQQELKCVSDWITSLQASGTGGAGAN